jgi:hypothetical protein
MTTYETAPWPGYETPPTLREALDSGTCSADDLDAWRIGCFLGGWLEGDRLAREIELDRAYVETALEQDARYCPPFREGDQGPYVRQWPSQATLNGHQWMADLFCEPELVPRVLEALTEEQRQEVDRVAAQCRADRAIDEFDWNGRIRPLPFNVRKLIVALVEAGTEIEEED